MDIPEFLGLFFTNKEWEIFHHLLFPLVEELVVLLADLPGPLSTLLFQQERSRMLQDNINSQIGS